MLSCQNDVITSFVDCVKKNNLPVVSCALTKNQFVRRRFSTTTRLIFFNTTTVFANSRASSVGRRDLGLDSVGVLFNHEAVIKVKIQQALK